MPSENWERLGPLLQQALHLREADRARFLDELRQTDPELGQALASLLSSHHAQTQDFDHTLSAPDNARGLSPFSENQIVLDKFRIVRFLGKGGMGEVYEAIDLALGRVALKTILPQFGDQEQILRRFKQEVQLARKVTSPSVCRVHELFLSPPDDKGKALAFLSMEFLEGETLAAAIGREGPLPLDRAESIALDLCTALTAMHSVGIVHRDLKARNIMLVPVESSGTGIPAGGVRAVVMDLGLAREVFASAAAAAETASAITIPGSIMGTPAYMAPEQFEGHEATSATDVYAFGVVLYEMITGHCPFQAPTPVAAAIRRARRPPPPSSVRADAPRHWDQIIERCLEYEPERRYQSAAEIAAALKGRRRPALRLAAQSASRRWTAAALGLILATGAVLFLARERRGNPPPPPEAKRWYDLGASAIRDGTWLKATNAFSRAVSLWPDFALAHAGLADAWGELDFSGKANEEMVRASAVERQRRLPSRDRQYLDAVGATLTRDFPTAIRDYAAILRELAPQEKAYGYVDLGRAYEKATKIPEALKNYEEAAKLAPEDPAPFVHIGILESRAGKAEDAENAFVRADELYRAASNQEGIAEVDYQQGYAATVHGDLKSAREDLERSLRAAQEIPSVQLEIRALTRLGMAEEETQNLDEAIVTLNRAISLARENGLDYWATDGLIRLATVWLDRGDYAKAEPPLQEALHLAHEGQRPRLEALAQATLASVRQQQGKPDETIQLAQSALDYYRKGGFASESVSASTLLVRARWAKGDLKGALADALQTLAAAKKSGAPLTVLQAEELAGGVLLDLERYPDALVHLQAALDLSRATGEDPAYHMLDYADITWRLGRYREAEQTLDSVPANAAKQPNIETRMELVRARIALSQGNFSRARDVAGPILQRSGVVADDASEAGSILAQALAGLHSMKQAERAAGVAMARARQSGSQETIAKASLAEAELWTAAGSADRARPLAETAYRFFSASEQKESALRSILCLARIASISGDPGGASGIAAKGVDILSAFQHNWGTSAYESYISRPDIKSVRLQLLALTKQRE